MHNEALTKRNRVTWTFSLTMASKEDIAFLEAVRTQIVCTLGNCFFGGKTLDENNEDMKIRSQAIYYS